MFVIDADVFRSRGDATAAVGYWIAWRTSTGAPASRKSASTPWVSILNYLLTYLLTKLKTPLNNFWGLEASSLLLTVKFYQRELKNFCFVNRQQWLLWFW